MALLLLNTASVGTFACDGLFTRHSNTGAESMVAWFNGTLYANDVATFVTVPSGQSIFTAGQRVGGAEYENYLFMGNGGSIPMKYKDNELTRHGIYPPTTTMTVATAATGSALTGQYQYKVSYVNSNLVESDVYGTTPTFTAASENIALTSIPVAPQSFGVDSRRLYRTENSGTVFYRLATLSDNTTTTYEDAILDIDLGVAAPSDNGVPPNYKSIVYHSSRMFVH